MFAIVIAFASLVIALPSAAQDLADVIEKCERSVVRIEVKGKDGDSLGSGFIVDGKWDHLHQRSRARRSPESDRHIRT